MAVGFGQKETFLSFDGTDDSVDIGDPDALEPTDTITVAFWFKSTTAADDAYSAVRHDGHINPLQLTSGDVGRAVHFIGGTFYTAKFTWSDWNDGNWHFYVARYDSGVGMEVYIDDMTTTVATNTTTGTLDTTTNPWCLGAAIGRSAEYWDGSLDIVFIFNKALSEDERVRLKIKQHRNMKCTELNKLYWGKELTMAEIAEMKKLLSKLNPVIKGGRVD